VLTFTSQDLQQRTGDIQRAATREPVLITSHGKPRNIVMSTEEYSRLKKMAGEELPSEVVTRRPVTLRAPDDPLGYDTNDFDAAVSKMIEDVKSGRTASAVAIELGNVRRLFGEGAL
jgi:prevent-host-death family protein